MEDTNSMCERILKTLENIFKTDPDLYEFSIVHTETTNTTNKSPVLYEEHNIGLESWCIEHIYRYAYKELFDIRIRQQLGRQKLTFDQKQNLNHLLIGVLLINPDVTTFWNMKRELIDEQILLMDNELQFTKIVLSYKSKSNETFTYRRWLLRKILSKYQTNNTIMVNIRNLLQNELDVCERAAGKSPNNYHAWNHRIWIIENFLNICDNPSNLLLDELQFSYQWIMKHVSEHAGYHYRQYLIDSIRTKNIFTTIIDMYQRIIVDYFNLVVDSNQNQNILQILLFSNKNNLESFDGEENNQLINYLCLLLFDLFKTMNELYQIFPGHESLWYYRRYLIYRLFETIYNYYYSNNNNNDSPMKFHVKLDDSNFIQTNQLNIVDFDRPIFYIYSNNNNNEKQLKLSKTIPNRISESLLYRTLIKNEHDFIKKNNFCTYFDDEYAKRYEKWLKLVLCLDLS